MDTQTLQRHFADCDLPIKFVDVDPRPRFRWLEPTGADAFFYADVITQRRNQQHFRVYADPRATLNLVDKNPAVRHLLLHVRCLPENATREVSRQMLLGHDERQLFIGVTSVREALAALKPPAVERAERQGLKIIRQGDWFFTPTRTKVTITSVSLIYHNEAIGGPNAPRWGIRVGNPHIAEEQVLVFGPRYIRNRNQWELVGEQLNAVFVRGKIRHVEHATIELRDWHSAVQNTMSAQSPILGYFD